MSYAFSFSPDGGVVAIWHSNRVAATNQVFATRWDPANAAAGFATPPQQVTTSATANSLPHALLLPPGDVVVVYETATQDIQFKRAPLLGLNAAAEQPVAATAGVSERHPFAVLSGSQLVFFWHQGQGTPTPRWMYRRRLYTATWLEVDATWVDAAGQELSSTDAAPSSVSVGDFHAAVDGAGDIWITFRTLTNDIQALRLTPAGGLTDQQVLTPNATVDQEPFVVIDGNAAVWVFWRSPGGVHYQRFMRNTNTWEANRTDVPDTNVGANNTRPTTVRDTDGAIWLFWVSDRGGAGNDIWLNRRNPVTGGWGQARQITGSPANDNQPFAALAPNGVVWLFWRSDRAGNFDLYFKQMVTAI
jgi:hypothetical protein